MPFLILLLVSCSAYPISDSLHLFKNRMVRLDYQNDYFNATDYYFTQGVRFDVWAPVFSKFPVSKLLLKLGKKAEDVHGMFFSQECFTPTSIRSDTILTGNRPFAACIFIGQVRISSLPEKKTRLTTEIVIGLLGSRAGCMETQQTIHGWIQGIDPHGWQYQVANDLILNYYAKYDKLIISRKYVELLGFCAIRAGTLYDNLSLGTKIRTGVMSSFSRCTKNPQKKYSVLPNYGDNLPLWRTTLLYRVEFLTEKVHMLSHGHK